MITGKSMQCDSSKNTGNLYLPPALLRSLIFPKEYRLIIMILKVKLHKSHLVSF
jgi:hypothetical protein